ncbi:MAG TPA: FAD-dependent oxidoreductase [Acidobacteriota bacterium]|jgi:NADPH-dependent 2,4-dienoyl-CoA reductase/sulfur reductase-like enzyme
MVRFGKKRVVVIGGNAAGMTAASRLLRLDPDAEVIVLEKSQYISYSICGAPYYLEGLIPAAEDLLAFTPETARKERRILARTEWECFELLPGRREAVCRHLRSGLIDRLPFDNLVLATGYRPAIGNIAGAEHAKVFKISQLENIVELKQFVETRRPGTAVVVGGGYIGLNLAEALVKRGLSVQLLDRGDQILRAVDADIASLVEEECRKNGLQVSKFAPVNEILFDGDQPAGVVAVNQTYRADLVVVDVGIVPEVELARQAGLRIGSSGAVAVSPRMETSQDGIYAAGNCAEAIHFVTRRPIASGLGTHAVKQGRVAGENIAGIRSEFTGVLQTSITKFFSLSVARTGLNEWEAKSLGFPFGAVSVTTPSRAGYFPPKERLTVKMIFDKKTERLLGAQIAGPPWTAKRIDVAATAITAGLTLQQIAQLDLAYSPPHAPLWDPIQVAANVALREMR